MGSGALCWLLLAALCWMSSVQADPPKPFFSKPYSGERVTEYEITLPVTAQEEESFHIPADCTAAHAAFQHGAQQWGSRVEREMWDKVMRDCYYLAFLQQSGAPHVHDFVSSYDFMNADLRDLPIWERCGSKPEANNSCQPLPPGVVDLALILANTRTVGQDGATPEACRIVNGRFRGWVEYKKDGIACRTDHKARGFRIIAVDLADVNMDGYLDAVIRLVPIGKGYRHIPFILPLTRKKADGPFTIPQNLAAP
jgi:hypothetical protein